jgi:nitric oxide reductase NorE protein
MQRAKHVPGEVGIWVLVFIDLTVFGALFVNYTWTRSQPATGSSMGLTGFDRDLGCLNTLVLLSSSWFVAMAMTAARGKREATGRRFILGALAMGAVFVAIKAYEYGEKFVVGITPATNAYFTYFFTLTGLHLFHLLVGMCVLLWMRARMAHISSNRDIQHLESGATFWHLVDLLWIVIFPLIYFL